MEQGSPKRKWSKVFENNIWRLTGLLQPVAHPTCLLRGNEFSLCHSVSALFPESEHSVPAKMAQIMRDKPGFDRPFFVVYPTVALGG